MGNEHKGVSRLEGTAWHVGYIRKKENDPRRHKSRCIYHNDNNMCGYRLDRCGGSAHCKHYKDAVLEKEKREYKARRTAERATDGAIMISNMAQVGDTLELMDVRSGKKYIVVLENGMENTMTVHAKCLGKYIGSIVPTTAYTYKIVKITKPGGAVCCDPETLRKATAPAPAKMKKVVAPCDTVRLKDVDSGENFEITLDKSVENAPKLHGVCLGKSVGDCVSVNEFTYRIVQIQKSSGGIYNKSTHKRPGR